MTIRHATDSADFVNRPIIAVVHLAVLVLFVAVEQLFARFHFPTPTVMLIAAAAAALWRLVEIALARRAEPVSVRTGLRFAVVSVALGLILPFVLAMTTQQFHTHYFGLLILPVLESALFFSLPVTLLVAGISGACALFWVAYAAHFHPPFQLGEELEASTLVLVFFLVGTLTWALLDRLSRREQLLSEQVEELRETRSRLVEEEKLAAVGRLASAVAHEIRNPVAIIASAMEAASSEALSPPDREEMTRVAMAETRRLEKLTTDFLTYAQPRRSPWTACDTAALTGYLGSIARAQALGKGVSVSVQAAEGCIVFGNEDELQQTLLNLMRNAIDAAPRDGHVRVAVERDDDEVTIRIENDGPAIPDYAVRHIFEPFFTAKPGGTGLGLSIAQKVAEAHHGVVCLEYNAPGQVVFALRLPAHLAGARQPQI